MARANGIHGINEAKIMSAVSSDIERGADFVNIFRNSLRDEYLILTSLSTWALKKGLLSATIKWQVSHDDLAEVRADRRLVMSRVVDLVELRTRSGQEASFWLGI